MKDFDGNKIAAAVLMVGAFIVGTRLVADAFYNVAPLSRPAYMISSDDVVPVVSQDTSDTPTIEKIDDLMATADIAAGKLLSRKCLQCHTFDDGGKNKIGPNLWHFMDKPIGAAPDYSYSKAFSKLTGTWTVEQLNQFLFKPRQYAPGTKMTFAGFKKPQDRADIIAYMNSLSPAPKKMD